MTVGELVGLIESLRGRSPGVPQKQAHGWAIVVLDRGFVYVGQTDTDGDWCVIQHARNIRYWGTTRGLGELVADGPTGSTKLDYVGTVKAPMRSVISILPTREDAWKRS
jgi:hypothetical protein